MSNRWTTVDLTGEGPDPSRNSDPAHLEALRAAMEDAAKRLETMRFNVVVGPK